MRILLVLTGLLVLSGCAFDEGEPWGQAEMQVSLSWAPPADRLDANGALRTSDNYAIQIDTIALSVESATLVLSSGGSSDAFDPADPPEGYSLCHNGHCHAADGRLVSYEEIAAEISGVDATTTTLVQPINGEVHTLTPSATATSMGACPDKCALPQGTASRVSVEVGRLHLSGTVFDTLDPPRIPTEGIPFTGALEVGETLDAPLSEAVGHGESVGLGLDIELPLTTRLFDGVDWPVIQSTQPVQLEMEPTIHTQILDNLREHSLLTVSVYRN